VLRGIRFKTAFGFEFDPRVVEAIQSPKVAEALWQKVSRQRVGIEINKMLDLGGDRTRNGLELVMQFNLQDVVLPLPPYSKQEATPDGNEPTSHNRILSGRTWSSKDKEAALECLHWFAQPRVTKNVKLDSASDTSRAQSLLLGDGIAILSSLLLPKFLEPIKANPATLESVHGRRAIERGINQNLGTLFKEGLSLSNDHAKCVGELLKTTLRFLPLFEALLQQLGSNTADSALNSKLSDVALWLRAIDRTAGEHTWETAVRLAFIARRYLLDLPSSADPIFGDADSFVETVKAKGIPALSYESPLLTGQEIMDILQVKEGVKVGQLKDQFLSWQLKHKAMPTKEEAIAFLRTLA